MLATSNPADVQAVSLKPISVLCAAPGWLLLLTGCPMPLSAG